MKINIRYLLVFTFVFLLAGASSYNYMSAATGKIGTDNVIFTLIFIIGTVIITVLALKAETVSALAVVSVFGTASATLSFLLLYSNIFYYNTFYNSLFAKVTDNFLAALIFTPFLGLGVISTNRLLSSVFFISSVITVLALACVAFLVGRKIKKILLECAVILHITLSVTLGAGRFAVNLPAVIDYSSTGSTSNFPDFSLPALIYTIVFIFVWFLFLMLAFRYESRTALLSIIFYDALAIAASLLMINADASLLEHPGSVFVTLASVLFLSGYSGAQRYMIPAASFLSAAMMIAAVMILLKLENKRRGYLSAE